MLKIMIADDERIIREGLSEAINWSDLDLELIGTAKDGEDALALAKSKKPDICLVDIMMPLVNGLDFIERMQQIRSDIQFIIITGYDEFQYAQKAIKLKIFDYLLKPIDEDELERVLRNAIEKIKHQEITVRRINVIEDQLEKTLPETQKTFITDCLDGKCSLSDKEQFESLFDIKFSNNIGVGMLRITDCVYLGEERTRPEFGSFIQILKNCIMEEIADKCRLLMMKQNEDNCLIFVVETDNIDLREICNDIQVKIESDFRYRTYIFCDKTVKGIHTIDETYATIMHAVNSGDKFVPIIRMAKKYIDDNYMYKELTLSRIAEEYNVSTGHISRLFKKELGISFSDYLEKKRINKAVILLEEDNHKIYEIAEIVGYSSQHYFCSAFKKAMGISPSEYKRK